MNCGRAKTYSHRPLILCRNKNCMQKTVRIAPCPELEKYPTISHTFLFTTVALINRTFVKRKYLGETFITAMWQVVIASVQKHMRHLVENDFCLNGRSHYGYAQIRVKTRGYDGQCRSYSVDPEVILLLGPL